MVASGSGDAFERAAAELDYPMLIATTSADGELSGCLVGFATQVSLLPARFLVCLSDKNHTFRVAGRASHLAVHYVAADQVELARLFGEQTGDTVDKFARCEWSMAADNLPVLAGAEFWFAGPIVNVVRFGDHTGFVIEPDRGDAAERSTELLSSLLVRDFEPGHKG
ncbi:flavin reductase family protein [Tomitella biformata]|uniref:flavin reductase family protein n=1 Tax=Tomitella biformata TaxID=630403 RepID=UPI000464A289|nr:flavin reductase family protein [Tomitella biformata]